MTDPVQEKIDSLGDWRGPLLARIRAVILAADADIAEEIKWRKPTNPLGVVVWSRAGIICTGETYRDKVKLTFMKGAAVSDPGGLFNASLDGVRRAIDIRQDDAPDEAALTALIRAAIAINLTGKRG
ncbi:DUF1801 domain-containing protein [Sphingomonas nostoxanthinifaciens]|uniref:DUF1801 domain-containing protein n=1 Tax=Sphingomonas nostoxanthinifaciens TaxID=2872652 RepID=UPI001CC21145|nr:DUF1801 domain-containing protein [Sphingomonas nostoxanthinifaciens]UAK23752.1 DUF1801 domain-containing protein [Sphingomonas nostoxanthinifaciens]